MKQIDEVAGIPPVERYTYVYDMNSQQLDHIFISTNLEAGAEVEHLHVNNWLKYSSRASDHDPSVAKVNLCNSRTTSPKRCTTHEVEDWCAQELPTFDSFTTCVFVDRLFLCSSTDLGSRSSSALTCWNDSWSCYSTVPFPRNAKCTGYQAQCTKDSGYCAKCLIGSCGPSFPE